MRSFITFTESSDPIGPDLVTLEDVKLDMAIVGTTEDASLSARITRASEIIADYCDRRFAFAQAVETFAFEPNETSRIGNPLWLSLYPLAEIVSVMIDGAELEAGFYDVRTESGTLWRLDADVWSGRIVVTYSGGYFLPDEAPGGLAQACLELIRINRASGTLASSTGIREIDHGDTRVVFDQASRSTTVSGSSALPLSVTDLLGLFRRLSFA